MTSATSMAGVAIGALALALATPARAQTAADPTPPAGELPSASQTIPAGTQAPPLSTDTAGRQVYDAAYFTPYSPSTALQIVERVPGFSIAEVQEGVRGFSGAAGNVVINGQRPSSKTDTVETILARIPASRVTRVEVGAGEQFGAEYSGKAQVLNLVLNGAGGLAGTIEGSVLRDFTGKILPEGSASMLLRSGPSTFNLAVAFDNDSTTEEGYDRITALPGGEEREYRRKINYIDEPNGSLSGSWEYNGGTYRTAHLNGRLAFNRFKLSQENDVFPVGGTIRDDRLTQRYNRDDFEIGGDVTRPFAGGGLKLIGLATRRYRLNRETSYNRVQSTVIGGSTQQLDDTLEETLLRVVWNRADWQGWSIETGAEGVINRLDSRVDLYAIAAGGAQTRIDLPVDQAVVKELRGEAFVNAGRALSPELRIDLGLTYEASQITVSGDAESERTLKFLKPKLVLDWRPEQDWRLQFSLQRTVAQLQFEDFISSAELSNGRVNGGNADLVPQRAWEALATVEHPILGDGLVKLELGYNQVSLVQDRVPTPEGFDAPGNLGDGRMVIVRSRIDAPLTKLGIKGGRLTWYNSLVATSVEDPYTREQRRFSGNSTFYSELTFRQDLGKFAWGLTLDGSTKSTFFRRDETDTNFSRVPYVSAFAEWRPDPRTSLTFGLDNVTEAPAFRKREFYTPDRRTNAPSLFEFRERNKHIIPSISFKRSFG